MITLSEKIIARDARYESDYSIFPVYLLEEALIQKPLTYEPCSDKLLEKISKTIEYYETSSKKVKNQKWAYYQILQEDLLHWLDVCRKKIWQSDIDEKIFELNEKAINDIETYLEIDYKNPYPVYIKKDLPPPFDKFDWDALNVRPKFYPDIPVGIYFSKKRLSEYSKILLYHEHLHVVITPEDEDFHFVPWFDEGVCDVISHILSAKNFSNWENLLEMMIRKYTIDDIEYQIRGWNAKTIAQLILNYGMNFLRYIIKKRKKNPQDINWRNLYYFIKKGVVSTKELKNCFKSKIPLNILKDIENPLLEKEEQEVCKRLISYQLPIIISPLAYWSLQKFLDYQHTEKKNGFDFLSYKEILKFSSQININKLKKACLELNGLLSISAEKDGIRSWDTIGYYKDILNYNLIKVKGNINVK